LLSQHLRDEFVPEPRFVLRGERHKDGHLLWALDQVELAERGFLKMVIPQAAIRFPKIDGSLLREALLGFLKIQLDQVSILRLFELGLPFEKTAGHVGMHGSVDLGTAPSLQGK
jgi:hypothetical protein